MRENDFGASQVSILGALLFKEVITGDESWVHGYGIENKVQSTLMEGSSRAKTEKSSSKVRSNVKVLPTVFFNCNGMVHHEFS